MAVAHEPCVHLIRDYEVEEAMLNYRQLFDSQKMNTVSTMNRFQNLVKQPQHQLLLVMQKRLYNDKKFRPPEYFYVRNEYVFQQRKTRTLPIGFFEPSIFPLIGFQEKESFYGENYTHRLWLLKPSYYSSIGNSTIVSSKRTFTSMASHPFDVPFSSDDIYFHNISPGDDELKTFRRFFSKTMTCYREDHHRYVVARSIFSSDLSGRIDKNHFVRTVDILDHPEFQAFKEYWPIFDWDSLVTLPFQSTKLPTSL